MSLHSCVTARARVENPVEEMLSEVGSHDARYLVVVDRKRMPVSKAIFDSVTQSVLLNAEPLAMTVMYN